MRGGRSLDIMHNTRVFLNRVCLHKVFTSASLSSRPRVLLPLSPLLTPTPTAPQVLYVLVDATDKHAHASRYETATAVTLPLYFAGVLEAACSAFMAIEVSVGMTVASAQVRTDVSLLGVRSVASQRHPRSPVHCLPVSVGYGSLRELYVCPPRCPRVTQPTPLVGHPFSHPRNRFSCVCVLCSVSFLTP